MALETKLVQKLSQSLLMTPQLQQAIKLLQLGRLEYIEAIEKELLENPILEEVRENEDPNASAKQGNGEQQETTPQFSDGDSSDSDNSSDVPNSEPKIDWEDYLDSFTDYRGSATPKGLRDFDDQMPLESKMVRVEDLQDHIFEQIRLWELNDTEKKIVFNIIGNLNKDGYLCLSHEEIAKACECGVEEVEGVIQRFKYLDPSGIGARDLRECLLIQLDNLGLGDGLEAKIIREHLDKLEKRKYDQIAKVEEVAVEEVYKAVTAIQQLEPRPGRNFGDDTARYIVPDIYVYKVDGEWIITLNEDGLPKLRVSPYYLQLLRNKDTDNNPNRDYLQERLKAASWLIRSIHQRQQTIFKVAESIVKFQKEFFEEGVSKLKPLVLKDVAEDIGMHESTVSRVTTNKYMHSPQGVFELKYFFTSGLKGGSGDVSSESVKKRIQDIIAAEAPEDPISDQKIVEMLGQEGIKIARRTVAKYREVLGIESSSRRKRLF